MNTQISGSNRGRFTFNRKSLATLACAAALLFAGARNAEASTFITGTVEAAGKYLVTGASVNVTTNVVLKMSFENVTPGTNLELCAGNGADFIAGTCPTRLNDSGGPGFTFLTIADALSLNGKLIYVLRVVGSAPATFRLTIE